MSSMTPELQSALQSENPLPFLAVEVNLPEYDLRLVDGAAKLILPTGTFVGRDPTYGVMIAVDPPEDGMGGQVPTITITVAAPSDTAANDLADPAMQGSRVRLWLGAVNRADGSVIPEPLLLFDGELDQPTLTTGVAKCILDYDCVSVFDLFFDVDEGMRLADSFHQSIFPGELGFQNVTGIVKTIIWGPGDSNV